MEGRGATCRLPILKLEYLQMTTCYSFLRLFFVLLDKLIDSTHYSFILPRVRLNRIKGSVYSPFHVTSLYKFVRFSRAVVLKLAGIRTSLYLQKIQEPPVSLFCLCGLQLLVLAILKFETIIWNNNSKPIHINIALKQNFSRKNLKNGFVLLFCKFHSFLA